MRSLEHQGGLEAHNLIFVSLFRKSGEVWAGVDLMSFSQTQKAQQVYIEGGGDLTSKLHTALKEAPFLGHAPLREREMRRETGKMEQKDALSTLAAFLKKR